MQINQNLGKTYETNQEEGQYKSVSELKIYKNIIEFYRFFWSFYLVCVML